MNIVKKEIIDALFIKAVELSKNPELLNNGLIMTSSSASDIIRNEYFSIRKDDSINNIHIDKSSPLIHINLSDFNQLNEITRVYVIMFCAFVYYTSFFDFMLFSSSEREADKKTINYLNNNGLFNYESVRDLLNSLRDIFCKYGYTIKVLKRMRYILNVIPVEYFSKN